MVRKISSQSTITALRLLQPHANRTVLLEIKRISKFVTISKWSLKSSLRKTQRKKWNWINPTLQPGKPEPKGRKKPK
jgi:hypothetical protein